MGKEDPRAEALYTCEESPEPVVQVLAKLPKLATRCLRARVMEGLARSSSPMPRAKRHEDGQREAAYKSTGTPRDPRALGKRNEQREQITTNFSDRHSHSNTAKLRPGIGCRRSDTLPVCPAQPESNSKTAKELRGY